MSAPGPVRVHLHHAMCGSYPLRLLDVLFHADRAQVVEYALVTPADIVTGAHRRRAEEFASSLATDGLEPTLASARDRRTIEYDRLRAVRVFDGGWLGRETLRVETADGEPLRVRVHADLDVDAFVAALETTLEPYDVVVERRRGTGLRERVPGLSPR